MGIDLPELNQIDDKLLERQWIRLVDRHSTSDDVSPNDVRNNSSFVLKEPILSSV